MASESELDFGMKCIKYMLCVANLMFVLVGLLLISIGATIKNIYTNFDEFMEAHYYNPSTLAIVIGFLIFGIAVFGCVGAFKQSTCLVNTYALFLAIVLVLELAVTIAAYSMRPSIENTILINMQQAQDKYNIEYNAFTWNATQFNLQCCGVHNYSEWNQYNNTNFPLTSVVLKKNEIFMVPTTCCVRENCTESSLYRDGCLYRLTYIVSQCALLLAVGALCVSFIQILGIVFATMLAKSIRKIKTQYLVQREERRRAFYEQMAKNERREKPVTPTLYIPKESDA